MVETNGLENRYARKGIGGSNPPASAIFRKPFSKNCGIYWTKFECISGKIQMIKNTNADEAGRNNLSGGMDSPCLGCFLAREERGLEEECGRVSAEFSEIFFARPQQ